MKFHQKLNKTEDMKPMPGRFSLQKCASSCLFDVDSCQHGWAYSSTNEKVILKIKPNKLLWINFSATFWQRMEISQLATNGLWDNPPVEVTILMLIKQIVKSYRGLKSSVQVCFYMYLHALNHMKLS